MFLFIYNASLMFYFYEMCILHTVASTTYVIILVFYHFIHRVYSILLFVALLCTDLLKSLSMAPATKPLPTTKYVVLLELDNPPLKLFFAMKNYFH